MLSVTSYLCSFRRGALRAPLRDPLSQVANWGTKDCVRPLGFGTPESLFTKQVALKNPDTFPKTPDSGPVLTGLHSTSAKKTLCRQGMSSLPHRSPHTSLGATHLPTSPVPIAPPGAVFSVLAKPPFPCSLPGLPVSLPPLSSPPHCLRLGWQTSMKPAASACDCPLSLMTSY